MGSTCMPDHLPLSVWRVGTRPGGARAACRGPVQGRTRILRAGPISPSTLRLQHCRARSWACSGGGSAACAPHRAVRSCHARVCDSSASGRRARGSVPVTGPIGRSDAELVTGSPARLHGMQMRLSPPSACSLGHLPAPSRPSPLNVAPDDPNDRPGKSLQLPRTCFATGDSAGEGRQVSAEHRATNLALDRRQGDLVRC